MRGQKIIGLIVVLLGLAGCNQEKELGEFSSSEIKSLNVTDSLRTMTNNVTGQEMTREVASGYGKPQVNVVTGGEGSKNSQWQSDGIANETRRSIGGRGADADYIDKADVYWKLNWIRQKLQSGNLPSNLKEAVAKTRKILMTTLRDRNFNTAEEAVIALEEGIEHMEAQRTLTLGNIDMHLIPWGAGRAAVERHFDKDKGRSSRTDSKSSKYLNRPGGSLTLDLTEGSLTLPRPSRLGRSTTALTSSVKDAQAIAVSYADKYGASPEEMMRRSWQKAIEQTNKLRDDLGLMNRTENSDRNDVSVPMVFGTSTEQPSKMEEMDSTTSDVVPIPSIQGNMRRVDVPDSTFKEPVDPFAESKSQP